MAPSKKAGKKGAAAAAPKKGGATKVQKADWKEGFKKKQVGVSDMTLLTTISNESVNENLEKRWKNGEIYTYIGQVLISVNPFRDLGIYTEAILESYRGKNRLEMPPHVFAIAESSYYNMKAYKENQCVIISGESGAGKTEAAKRIMQYIAAVSGGQDSSITEIKEMVLATNPLLESFGCAKTLRNDNSSRHGKYLEIMFNSNAEPIGAQITNYLLEKNRVVGQIANERDFHIFYQFTKGASDEQREAFGLQGPEAYTYTSRSNCLNVASIDDLKDFKDTLQAMNVVGLSADEQNNIFRMIAAILWLGNVTFTEDDGTGSQITDTGVTDFVAYLLEVDPAAVAKAMVNRTMEVTRTFIDVPLNPAQASSGRDALAKALYNNLFEWIVSRVNISMKPRQATAQVIGVLDIYGFEIFQDNSFEQLCINYVNEKLQQIFIELTLKTEQEEYVKEQIKWTPIKYFNNKIVCDLIEERRPPGIFAALNDATATAHADPAAADSSFIQRSAALASNPHFESRGAQFLVKHYAGDVMYTVAGMTDKNKDALVKDLTDLIASSGNQFLQSLFPDRPDPNSKKRPPSAGDKIKASAGALVENLMRAQPAYIRTIKSNQNRSATEYDTKAILHQIKYLGLQENIRVRRAGFAYRNTFEKMVERFYLLSPATSYAGEYTWTGDARSGCEKILTDVGIAREEWQMGVTKAFIKNPETASHFRYDHLGV
ncbi:class II myosin [Ceratobasidium sp. 428]|nr:class II myosin [Ceratobasidium sp. 428]